MKSKIILDEAVENKDRKFGSNLQYFPAIVINIDGNEHNALFTANQIEEAINRADINPEDMPEKSGFLSSIFG